MSPCEDVLGHRQVLEDRRLLIHRDDPKLVRRLRIRDPPGLSVNEQTTLVGLNDPGENLHERRLAGAVFAH